MSDPRPPADLRKVYGSPSGDLRIGHVERERAVDELRQHAAAGRLDVTEFDERVGLAYQARTANELRRVLHDLPRIPDAHVRTPARARTLLSPGVVQWLGISLLMIVIWGAAGFGYFWPVWVIGPLGVVTVTSEVKRRSGPRPGGGPEAPGPGPSPLPPSDGWSDRL